jgi:hypothetical protein
MGATPWMRISVQLSCNRGLANAGTKGGGRKVKGPSASPSSASSCPPLPPPGRPPEPEVAGSNPAARTPLLPCNRPNVKGRSREVGGSRTSSVQPSCDRSGPPIRKRAGRIASSDRGRGSEVRLLEYVGVDDAPPGWEESRPPAPRRYNIESTEIPHRPATVSPGGSTIRPSPLLKASGAQVIGSTATARRRRSGASVSPVKTIT